MKRISRKWQVFVIFCIFWALLGLSFAYISYSVADSEKRPISTLTIFTLNLIKFFLWFAFAPIIFLLVKKLRKNAKLFSAIFFCKSLSDWL